MDGSWERVSYGKKTKEKLSKSEKRKMKESMPTVDSLHPTVRSSVYNVDTDSDDDDFQPQQQNGGHAAAAAAGGSGDRKSTAAASAGSKPKKAPSNNREILQSLPLSRVQQAYRQSKATIPDSPFSWLIDVCAVIDLQLNFDKKEEWNFSDVDFPSNCLSAECRSFLSDLLRTVSDDVKRRFFVHACQRLAKQSERRQCAMGTRAALQLAAKQLPQLANHEQCAPKLAAVVSEAKSSPAALTAAVWSICQCGYRDCTVGLRASFDCLMPLLQHKSSSAFVSQLLEEFASRAAQQQKSASKFSTQHALLLSQAARNPSLPQQSRERCARALRHLQPQLASAASAESGAALRIYDAAGGDNDAVKEQTLLPLLRRSLQSEPEQLPDLAARMFAAGGGSRRQLDLEIVQLVLADSGAGFARRQRRQFADALLPKAQRMPAAAADAVRKACRSSPPAVGFCRAACRLVLTGLLLLLLVATALLALSVVKQSSLPKFARPAHQFLEDKQILYNVRLAHSACGRHYRDTVLPLVTRRLEELSQLYHSRVAPGAAAAAAKVKFWYDASVGPSVAVAAGKARELYFLHLHAHLLQAAACCRDTAARTATFVESQLHSYLPNLLTAIGSATDNCASAVTGAAYAASGYAKSVYNSFAAAA